MGKFGVVGDIGIVDELIPGGILFTLLIPGGATYRVFLGLSPPALPQLEALPSPIVNVGGGAIGELFNVFAEEFMLGLLEVGSRNNPG